MGMSVAFIIVYFHLPCLGGLAISKMHPIVNSVIQIGTIFITIRTISAMIAIRIINSIIIYKSPYLRVVFGFLFQNRVEE